MEWGFILFETTFRILINFRELLILYNLIFCETLYSQLDPINNLHNYVDRNQCFKKSTEIMYVATVCRVIYVVSSCVVTSV